MATETNTATAQASAQPAGTPAPAPAATPPPEGAPAAAAAPPPKEEPAAPAAGTPPAKEEPAPKDGEKPKEEPAKDEPKEKEVPAEYKLTLSEKSPLPAARIDELALEAKEKGLTNDEAQELLNREETAVIEDRAREATLLEERKAGWITEIKNDPEMGGDNANKTAELASRFVDKFASPKLKEILKTTGMGDFPEWVRMCAKAGAATVGEGEIVPSGGGSGGQENLSHAETLYGGSGKK